MTDRCNLDCAYYTEYDKSWPHPSLDESLRDRVNREQVNEGSAVSTGSPDELARRTACETSPHSHHPLESRQPDCV